MQIFIRKKNILEVIIPYFILLIILGGSCEISAQSIKVISPNGEENWNANSTQLIKWESKNINKVKIEYSLDNGFSWDIIVKSVDASIGNYSWKTANVKTPYVLIRISDALNPFLFDVSDESFTLSIIKENKLMTKMEQVTSPTIKLMPLGDSITWGTNPDNSNSSGYRRSLYLQLVNAGYNVDFVGSLTGGLPNDFDRDNEGHPGWVSGLPAFDTTKMLSTKIGGFLKSNPPDIVLLLIGTNDCTEQDNQWEKTASELATSIGKLLDSIYVSNPNIKVFLGTIIDRGDNQYRHDKTVTTNSLLPSMINSLPAVQREKVTLIDLYTALGDYYNNFSNNNFTYQSGSILHTAHPNTNGYQAIADTWFDAIQNYYQPTLTFPANDTENQTVNVALSWSAPPAASIMSVNYDLQIAIDTNFTNIIFENSSIPETSIQPSGLKFGTKYFWRVRISGYGWSEVREFMTIPLTVSVKVFLQGPYIGNNTMSTTLNSKGLIPLSQPYNNPPWNYNGAENVNQIPSGVVDWVLLKLKENDSTCIMTRAAFLKSNGNIVDLDGTSPITFSDVLPGDYYVAIKHRNHLSVISSGPVGLTNNTITYDFTTDSSKYYGGYFGSKLLETNPTKVWGMIASDGNSDGFVNAEDLNLTWRPENGFDQYLKGDYNLDGYVNAIDKNLFWRSNNGKDSQTQ